jgi:hypothetical protein
MGVSRARPACRTGLAMRTFLWAIAERGAEVSTFDEPGARAGRVTALPAATGFVMQNSVGSYG